jgi:hypothetical protein
LEELVVCKCGDENGVAHHNDSMKLVNTWLECVYKTLISATVLLFHNESSVTRGENALRCCDCEPS